MRRRFEEKRAEDMAEIEERLGQVEVERAYRIIGVLEQSARAIGERIMPAVTRAKVSWRRRSWLLDALLFGSIAALFLAWSISGGHWTGLSFQHPWWLALRAHPVGLGVVLAVLAGGAAYLHFLVRRIAARTVRAGLRRRRELEEVAQWVLGAFDHNTTPWRSSLIPRPAGWGGSARRKIAKVLQDADRYVQALNSRFADPSGRGGAPVGMRDAAPGPATSPSSAGADASAAPGSDVVTDAPEVARPHRVAEGVIEGREA